MEERLLCTQEVGGSNPPVSTTFSDAYFLTQKLNRGEPIKQWEFYGLNL